MVFKAKQYHNEAMNTLRLNEVAIWQAKPLDEFSIRENPIGRPYEEDKIFKKTDKKSYRYAKNYKKGEARYCLLVVAYDENAEAVEKFLDKTAKSIKEEQAKNVTDLEWLNIKYKESK